MSSSLHTTNPALLALVSVIAYDPRRRMWEEYVSIGRITRLVWDEVMDCIYVAKN
jgi:hypothetical protein